MSEELRAIEVTDQVEKDDDLAYITDEGYWLLSDCWFADWKDIDAAMYGGAQAGLRGGEVVILEDGSDTYIIASTADRK